MDDRNKKQVNKGKQGTNEPEIAAGGPEAASDPGAKAGG